MFQLSDPPGDTDTSYLLKTHLLSNPKKSRKDVRYFSLEKVVDADFIKNCFGGRKKKDKSYIDSKNRDMKRTESSAPIFNMEDIEEGFEGLFMLLDI